MADRSSLGNNGSLGVAESFKRISRRKIDKDDTDRIATFKTTSYEDKCMCWLTQVQR